jgi:hypothetical protein
MKKYPCYLLALLLLLSACKQDGKLLCKVTYPDRLLGNRPDTSSMVYILPADKGKNSCLEKFYDKAIEDDTYFQLGMGIMSLEIHIETEKSFY